MEEFFALMGNWDLRNPLILALLLAVVVTALRMTKAIPDGRLVQLYTLVGLVLLGILLMLIEYVTRGDLSPGTAFNAVKVGIVVAAICTFGVELVKNVGGLLGIGSRIKPG